MLASCSHGFTPRLFTPGSTTLLGQRVRIAEDSRLGAGELRELNRIGVNLNQMARVINSGAPPPPGTREAVERVSELVARLVAGEME